MEDMFWTTFWTSFAFLHLKVVISNQTPLLLGSCGKKLPHLNKERKSLSVKKRITLHGNLLMNLSLHSSSDSWIILYKVRQEIIRLCKSVMEMTSREKMLRNKTSLDNERRLILKRGLYFDQTTKRLRPYVDNRESTLYLSKFKNVGFVWKMETLLVAKSGQSRNWKQAIKPANF